ncbi:MAG TPA: hypothetical protein VGX48_15890 [Pyrinomonadaceae bacterium]|jgi:hypothetical protein|nr:hypothetical protein [Pyrinomonadaceae bacterium]
MPVRESSATALVRFTGLGIIAFNEDHGRGEIAAVRDSKHQLTVKLQRPVFQEGAGHDLVVYQDIACYRNLPKEGVEIELKATRRPAVQGFEIYQGRGHFDRLSSDDPQDFRWIVNMNALHGGARLNPTGARHYPLTKIFIANALFYTHKLDTDLFFEKVERGPHGGESREVFGNVGETIGAAVEGDEVVFSIRFDGREETHTLPRVEGLPYRVEFKNMDYGDDAVYSDMADYYGFLSSPDGTHFDLAPVEEETGARGGSVNQKQFCHPVAADLDTVEQL